MQRGRIFRKGNSWHLRYKAFSIVDGKKVWRTTSTKLADIDQHHRTQQSVEQEAVDFLKTINPTRTNGNSHVGPTFKEQALIWLERCKNRQRDPIKPATIRGWRSYLNKHILPAMQTVPLPDVTNQLVKEFVATIHLSPKSINNIVQVIKQVKSSAVNEHGDEIYPTKWNHDFIDMPQIKRRQQRTPSFTAEQIERMIQAAPRQMQMMISLFAASGVRAGEMFGLEVRHFDGTSLKIEQNVWDGRIQSPKTENAYRSIELDPRVSKLLASFLGRRTQGFIFRNTQHGVIHQSNLLREGLHPLLEKLNIPQCGFHAFRRYRNTYLRNVANCPAGLLMYWLGHADKSMSDRYDKVGEGANVKFRRAQAKKMGIGFKLPKQLKPVEIRPRRRTTTARQADAAATA
jgi:integrase